MSKRPSEPTNKNEPGPGAYEVIHPERVGNKSPNYGQSKAPRDLPRSYKMPGPGSYETKHVYTGKPYGFGTSERMKTEKEKSPGLIYEAPSTFASIPKYQTAKTPGPTLTTPSPTPNPKKVSQTPAPTMNAEQSKN